MGSQYSNAENQINKGREALLYFHNDSVVYPNYGLTFDGLLNQVSKGKPSIFLESFGFAIESMDNGMFFHYDMGKVKDAMQTLASKAQGQVPANSTSFFSALSDEAMNYSFVDAAGFVGVETAKEVGSGVVQVGDTLLTTLKGLGYLFPIIVIGGIAFIAYSKVRKIAA